MWREQAVRIARIADELRAHPRERVRPKVALTRNEFLEGVAPRREDAVGTDEAQRVVDRRRGDKVLVGRRAQIFTIMNRVQTKIDASLGPVVLTSREV